MRATTSAAQAQVSASLAHRSAVLNLAARHSRWWFGAYLVIMLLLVTAAWRQGRDVAVDRVGRVLDARINSHYHFLMQAIERYRLLPEVVANSGDVEGLLAHPEPDRVAQVNRMLDTMTLHTQADDIYVLDKDGLTLSANRNRERRSIIGESYGDRPYFRNARAGQTGWFLGVGVSSHMIGYYLARPVMRAQVLQGVVAMRISLEPFSTHVRENWMRNAEIAFLTDRNGIVLVSPRERWRFCAIGNLSSAESARRVASRQYPNARLSRLPLKVDKRIGPGLELVEFADLPGRRFVQKSFESAELGGRIYVYIDSDQYFEPIILRVLCVVLVGIALLCMSVILLQRSMYRSQLVTAELLRRERALRESEERLQAILDHSNAVIYMRDIEGRFLLANLRLRDLAGGEVVGRSVDELFPASVARVWAANDLRVARMRQACQFDEAIQVGDEVRTYLSSKFPLFDDTGAVRAVCAVSTDITDRKRSEDEIQELNRTLEQRVDERTAELGAAKAAAEAANRTKSEFLATMSHEIRTPLHTIIGGTGLALRTVLSERQRDYLTDVNAAATALLDVINHILDMSKIEAGEMRIEQTCFDPRDVLARLSSIVTLRARGKGLDFIVRVAPGVPAVVVGDPKRLGQVLLNLVDNAIKFTAHGQVAVTLECAPTTARMLHFTVADTGIGIPPSEIDRLFEPFCQADQSSTQRHGGTGLGLTISKKLSEAMGGSVVLESTSGQGCEFLVRLPFGCPLQAVEISQQRPDAAGAMETEHSLRGVHVLVAEDNNINQRLATEILEAHGIVCATAANGAQAVAMALAPSAPFDLVLMDVRMPDMDGIEAARRIRAAGRTRLPIVAVTAHAMDQDVQRCIEAGMDGHLAKPFQPHQLIALIALHTGRRNPNPPARDPAPRGAPQALPAALAGFEGLADALDRLGGNDVLLRELILMFESRFGTCAAALRAALERDDLAHAQCIAHGLRGAAAGLGADQVAAHAARLERALRNCDRGVMHSVLAALDDALACALTAIRALSPVALPAPCAANAVRVDPDRSVPELIASLDEALAINSMEAVALATQLQVAIGPQAKDHVDRLVELRHAVDQLNYRGARAILTACSSALGAPTGSERTVADA